MANTVGAFNPPPHPASPRLARPSLHDMVLEHDGPLPFIWRNLVKWHGGKPNPDAAALHHLANGHDTNQPPHKRRRLSASDPTPAAASALAIASERPSCTLKEPPTSAAFLRLELANVPHRDSRSPGSFLDVAIGAQTRLPATCRVTLHQGQSLFDRVIHCQSLPCELILSKNRVGTYDILCAEPTPAIFIPRHALNVVNRRDGSFGLNQAYLMTIDLEAGHGSTWPPLPLPDMGVSPMGEVDQCSVLRGTSRELLGALELGVHLIPNVNNSIHSFPTHFVMKVNARWAAETPSLPLPSQSLPTPDNTTGSPQRTLTSSGFSESLGDRNLALVDDDDDDEHMDMDGAPTPSRSLRARRKEVNYNLKGLSDQASGRERRRLSQVHSAPFIRADQVCWLLAAGDNVCLDANRCLHCLLRFKNFNQLLAHLETSHSEIKHEARATTQGFKIRVAGNLRLDETPTKTFSQIRPTKRIDLQPYRADDQSWLSYNYEEGPNEEVQTPKRNRHHLAITPTARKSKSSPQQHSGQKRRRPTVPFISDTPLYHPVSKQLLTPGEELPQPAPDKKWILQKYREALREFTDITPEEREYMFKWDSFLQPLNVTTAEHLPTLWLAFVDKHADWLVDREHRMLEFGKHAALLFGRSLIKSSSAVTRRLDLARRLKQDRELQNGAASGTSTGAADPATEEGLSRSPRLEYIKRGGGGCVVCNLPVRGPKQLLCTGDNCLRIYHSTCAQNTAKMRVTSRKWLCNTCLDSKAVS